MAPRARGRIYMKFDNCLIMNRLKNSLQRITNMTSDTGLMKSLCFDGVSLKNKLTPLANQCIQWFVMKHHRTTDFRQCIKPETHRHQWTKNNTNEQHITSNYPFRIFPLCVLAMFYKDWTTRCGVFEHTSNAVIVLLMICNWKPNESH